MNQEESRQLEGVWFNTIGHCDIMAHARRELRLRAQLARGGPTQPTRQDEDLAGTRKRTSQYDPERPPPKAA